LYWNNLTSKNIIFYKIKINDRQVKGPPESKIQNIIFKMALKKGIKIEEPIEGEDGLNTEIKIFSASILQAHDYINNIKKVTYELDRIRRDINSYNGFEGEKRLSSEIDDNVNVFQVNEKKMHHILEMLEKEVKDAKKLDPVKFNIK